MRVASFRIDGADSWGVVLDRGVVDIGRRDPLRPSLLAALNAGDLQELAVDTRQVDFYFEDIDWQPVVTRPGKILCIGLNYEDHRKEAGRDTTRTPTVFARFAGSQAGHMKPILLPAESLELDFEGELAVVIGKKCRRVPKADVMASVAGYSCYNDATIRDFQRHSTQWTQGKNWPSTGAFGPWLVTADEIPDVSELYLETRLNSQVVQSASVGTLIHTIPDIISYCSTWTTLEPGDVIVTGTPAGVGMARRPPLWTKAGDVVEVEISGIGCLRNPICNETEV